ncbi:ferritin family protein [candidate division WOR-3 bacterium]|nr:ferritin family protein [candidate division WOR-3 bacterium]
MTQTKDQLLAGLKEAIMTEETGIQFYTAAAARTTDTRGREVFELLARDEAEHKEWLRRQYGHVAEGTPWEEFRPKSHADLSGPSPIFSDQLRARIGEAHWEMTALSVGLALEEATIARYRALAGAAERPDVRRFFEELAKWEESHAEALSRQSSLLKESYWQEARFAPF